MAANGIERQLKAIFSADVKGYSKLMGDDDEATVNTITAYRKIVTQLIVKHQGRVVDSPGDNILAEFKSTLNAVNSAIEIQNTLEAENLKLPANRRMDFRIGINLGDILHNDEAIPTLEKAIRLNPITTVNYLNNLAWANLYAGNYDRAITLWNQAIKKNPDYMFAHMGIAAAYQLAGHEQKGKEHGVMVNSCVWKN